MRTFGEQQVRRAALSPAFIRARAFVAHDAGVSTVVRLRLAEGPQVCRLPGCCFAAPAAARVAARTSDGFLGRRPARSFPVTILRARSGWLESRTISLRGSSLGS
jgi:hypothetical protein